jgi:hypothetical protein
MTDPVSRTERHDCDGEKSMTYLKLAKPLWIPAYAGMTEWGGLPLSAKNMPGQAPPE